MTSNIVRHVRTALAGTIVALSLLMPGTALARGTGIEISAGSSYTLRSKWTGAAFIEWTGATHPMWHVRWAPVATLGRIDARNAALGNHLHHTVWIGAAGARAYLRGGLFFGFQLAATDGRTDALSTPYEFVSSLGWQARHWVLMVRHISNGDTHKPNHGETMLLAGVRF